MDYHTMNTKINRIIIAITVLIILTRPEPNNQAYLNMLMLAQQVLLYIRYFFLGSDRNMKY